MTNNNILIIHLGGDGGNFLINCLSMSDHVYFNNLSKKDKVLYFFSGITNQPEIWNDICMWSGSITTTKIELNKFNTLKNFLIKSHYPLGIDKNDTRQLKNLKLIDHCLSRIKYLIVFENTILFSCLRYFFDENGVSKTCYQQINSDKICLPKDDFLNSLTIQEYFLLSEEQKNHLKNKYEFKFETMIQFLNDEFKNNEHDFQYTKHISQNYTFIWDVNWFLSEDDTVNNIQKLYQILEFDDWNENLIRFMYRMWIKKLDEIKLGFIKK